MGSVNMRAGLPPNARFVTAEAERLYDEEIRRARSAQRSRYAVAPHEELQTLRGVRRAGDEVVVEDFLPIADESGDVRFTNFEVLERLVRSGRVLERY